MLTTFWGVIFLIMPLFVIPAKYAVDPRISKDLFFVFSAFAASAIFGVKPLKNDIISTFLLLSFAIYTDFFSLARSYHLVCISASALIICQARSFNGEEFKKFLGIVCIIQSVIVAFQWFGFDIYREFITWYFEAETKNVNPERFRAAGSLLNPNLSSLLIALTLPALINKKIEFLLCFIALLMCGSVFPVASLLVGLSYYGYRKYKSKLIIFATSAIVAAAFVGSVVYKGRLNDHHRYAVWGRAISFNDNPILGNGHGYFADAYRNAFYKGQTWNHAHNEFVELYIALGLVGIFVLLKFIHSIRYKILEVDPVYGWIFVSGLFSCIGTFTMHISSTAFPVLVSLGIILRGKNDQTI